MVIINQFEMEHQHQHFENLKEDSQSTSIVIINKVVKLTQERYCGVSF